MVQWLFEKRKERCPAERNVVDWVAANGHLPVIKLLHERNVEGCTSRAMDWAAMNGHLETVKWLHKHRKEVISTMTKGGRDYWSGDDCHHIGSAKRSAV